MRRLYPEIRDEWRCETVGCIVESGDVDDLSEDMLDVSLPNGILVSVGWFDDHYSVSVTLGLDNLVPPLATGDADEAIRIVEAMVLHYRQKLVSHSDSQNEWKNSNNAVCLNDR